MYLFLDKKLTFVSAIFVFFNILIKSEKSKLYHIHYMQLAFTDTH